MEKVAIQFPCFNFFISLLLHTFPISSQEVEDEHQFDYPNNSIMGPSRWGELHQEWSKCSSGSMQSPIDLMNERIEVVPRLERFKRRYKASNATLKNRGHDMMIEWANGAGSIEINGTQYVLKQCHWHSPSEHTVNGKNFALAMHMVHEGLDGRIAVVGILYKIGRPDSFLSSLRKQLISVAGSKEENAVVGMVNPRRIKTGTRKYFRYMGSLTIPPCTENVLWTIVRKVRTVTRRQVSLLRVAVHDQSNSNARPIQRRNGLSVQLYGSKRDD